MTANDLKIAWRNSGRNKINSSINIAGLATGMAAFILILLFVQDELKYDRYLSDTERIYQVNLETDLGGSEIYVGKTPASVSAALARNFPEIEQSARVYRPGDVVMRSMNGAQQNFFTESSLLAVDSNFLEVFSFRLLEGSRRTCLSQPNAIVITQRMAQKYFGSLPALGQTLYMDEERVPFTVSGVLEDVPAQSTLSFDMLAPTAAFPTVKKMSWSWVWLQVCTYVKLRAGTDVSATGIKKIESKFPAMIRVESASGFKRVGKSYEELLKKGGKWNLHLQRFTDIHLHSAGIGQVVSNVSDIKYVYIFSAIALVIILLACVNFMNLSTAQASGRAREVGVRKVLGSGKKELVKQFLTEALLFSLAGAVIALVLVAFFIKPFNDIAGKSLTLSMLFDGNIWLYVLLLIVITGFLAGSYPAFFLASLQPATVVKSTTVKGARGFLIRNSLVVFQFAVSTALIICSSIVFKQLRFMQSKDLGLTTGNVLILSNTERLGTTIQAFKSELAAMPGIEGAGIASGVPTRENFGDGYVPEPSSESDKLPPDIGLSSFMADESFIPSLNIRIVQGRNFLPGFSDSASVILNEEAVKQIGWKNPLGSFLMYPGNNRQRFKVIAVVKDFNINSLHTPVAPFAVFNNASRSYDLGSSYILVKTRAGHTEEVLAAVKQKWQAFAPASPFDFMFLDEAFTALYKTEARVEAVLFIFTGLSIFVACLGLFGLSIFTAGRRSREISIRKLLGAPVSRLAMQLSADFVKLVLIAVLLALPLAWLVMHDWLQDFAYHISPGAGVFILAAGASLLIALVTVSFQAIKTAMANPAKNLRNG